MGLGLGVAGPAVCTDLLVQPPSHLSQTGQPKTRPATSAASSHFQPGSPPVTTQGGYWHTPMKATMLGWRRPAGK